MTDADDRAIALRPRSDADLAFLRRLYHTTRQQELAATGWDAAQIARFLDQQFEAQHAHYTRYYTDTTFDIIESASRPIGRLYLARWPDEFRLIDIALLPEYRNRGIGGRLIRKVIAEAAEAGLPVRIHVEPFNPALRLYERLGFSLLEERGAHWFMEKSPDSRGVK